MYEWTEIGEGDRFFIFLCLYGYDFGCFKYYFDL